MLRIRKVKTKSGATAIQVVQYIGHRSKIEKHIGSAQDNQEIQVLLTKATQSRLKSNQHKSVCFQRKSRKYFLLINQNVLQ